NHIYIQVKDDGMGITQQDRKRIFERFYCVDKGRSKKMGGTGLGLSIVKHIVEYNKGTIELTSEVGVGSTFDISLPMCEEPDSNA
ncbi:MAG: ATP-binding protein, partial [Eubacteriales bacterium]